MKTTSAVAMLAALVLSTSARAADPAKPTAAAPPAKSSGPELKTEDDKTLYAMGLAISRQIAQFNLSASELEILKSGLTDGTLNGPKKVELEAYMPKVQEFARGRAQAAAAAEKKAGEAFVAKAAAEKGAKKTESGIVIQTIKAGSGASPKATDTVKVHYTGKLTDGSVFDSSVERGEPATFPLNGVIKCWTEGLQTMKVGGEAKLTCPSDLAYGDRGSPPKIKPGATLVFNVQLLDIEKPAPAAMPAPAPAPGK